MTINSVVNRASASGNGVTTAFSFPYRFLANADLVVLERVDATGAETVKTLTTHYTVTGAGDAGGGTVTMLIAPATGVTLVIYRDPALTQDVDLVNNDSLPVETAVEQPLDRLTMIDQRNRELLERALRLPDGDTGFVAEDMKLPPAIERADMFLAFDADGAPIAAAGVIDSAIVTPAAASVLDDATVADMLATLGGVPKAIFDAKADLLTATGADTPARLATAADGLFLETASGESSGLRWGNPSKVCEGRLTLTTGVPVTTADVTAAETIYFTPYGGDKIALYDGTNWRIHTFTELSVDVPDVTGMHDVFVYDNAGTLTLEALVWTNDTTRATALATQNGVLVKSGATSRRYVGSFYSTTAGNGQTEDSVSKRYLYNYYNRKRKTISVTEATNTWTYTTATWRQANASAANQVEVVTGVSEDVLEITVYGICTNGGAISVAVGVGVDSTSVNSAKTYGAKATTTAGDCELTPTATYREVPAPGRHTYAWLEISQASSTTTWVGDNGLTYVQCGLVGVVHC